MTIEDKHACTEVILSWGLYRDQRRWPELLSTFHPDGEIAVSWFRGPFTEFVEHCKRGGMSKHLILPPVVRVDGVRAIAETSIVILVRQTIEGLAVDMNEAGLLAAFDSNRELICKTASKVYARGHKGSYNINATDF